MTPVRLCVRASLLKHPVDETAGGWLKPLLPEIVGGPDRDVWVSPAFPSGVQ